MVDARGWEYKRYSKAGVACLYPAFMKPHWRYSFLFEAKEPFTTMLLEPDAGLFVEAWRQQLRFDVRDDEQMRRRLIRRGATGLRAEAEELVVETSRSQLGRCSTHGT